MSDKVTKIRVNGVEKEIGGTGGGGSVSGAYLAPGELISSDRTGFTDATINPFALTFLLNEAKVPVYDVVLDSEETSVTYKIAPYYEFGGAGMSSKFLLYFVISSGSIDNVYFKLGDNVNVFSMPTENKTLAEILNTIFTENPDLNFTLNNNTVKMLSNCVDINYHQAGETLHYYIPNMTNFCEEVITEYHPSSSN